MTSPAKPPNVVAAAAGVAKNTGEVYPHGTTGRRIQFWSGMFFIGLFVCTCVAVLVAEQAPHERPRLVLLLSFLWAFLPPLWFWSEYFFIFPRWGRTGASETLREGQRLSLAIWAPIAIAVAAYGSSDHFKKEPPVVVPVTSTANTSIERTSNGGRTGVPPQGQ